MENGQHWQHMQFLGGGVATPYNGLHRKAPLERDFFFRIQVYKRAGISQVEIYERVSDSYFKGQACNKNISKQVPLNEWQEDFHL